MQGRKAGQQPAIRCVHGADTAELGGERLCGFFARSGDMLGIAGLDGYFKLLNPSWEKTLGFSVDELRSRPYLELVHPDDRASIMQVMLTLADGVPVPVFENRFRTREGSHRWLSWNCHPMPEKGLIYAVVRDVTARKEMERALQTANEELTAAAEEQMAMNEQLVATEEELRRQVEELEESRRALDQSNRDLMDIINFLPDATCVVGRDGTVVAWNKAMETLTGMRRETIIGRGNGAYAMAIWGKRQPMLMDAILSGRPSIVGFYESLRRDGDTLYIEELVPRLNGGQGAFVSVKAAPLRDREGNITGVIESVRDITERKRSEDKLKYLNTHDALTGLYNRHYFEQEIQRLESLDYPSVGIILCDVDGLKLVNDSLGHAVGNELLVAAANLVKGSFRKTDFVARIGGDEFGLLLPGYDQKMVQMGSERIRAAVRRYNASRPGGMPLSMSVGYAVSTTKPPNIHALYREADNFMHREKLHRSASARSATVQTLMKALETRDFITEGHADRMQELVARVGEEMGLSPRTVGDLRLLAQFHDIGKLGISDRILFKPGPLDPTEMKEMQQHCEIGYRIALSAPDLHPIADWILCHHEWWNGKGYPRGLEGEAIPLACRILALADAFDAMTNDRPYRSALSEEEALAELVRCAGTQFDPELTRRFIGVLETLEAP